MTRSLKRSLPCLIPWQTTSILVILFSLSFSVSSWGYPNPNPLLLVGECSRETISSITNDLFPFPDQEQWQILVTGRMAFQAQGEEKERFQEEYQRWETLPPDRRRELRHRMERWKELSPEDQELYRKRYRQWQELPPDERQRMRENLKGWDRLGPHEQEQIRKKFKGQ